MAKYNAVGKRSDKGKMKVVSKYELSLIKYVMIKNYLANSKNIFHEAGTSSVSRSTRCRILNQPGKCVNSDFQPPLKANDKVKCV